jgi:porphobilinogen synthase
LTRSPYLKYKEVLYSVGLQKEHLVLPIFVQEQGEKICQIDRLVGITKNTTNQLSQQIKAITDAGVSSILVFGIPKKRDRIGSSAANKNGIVQQTIRKIREESGDLLNIITDVCVCQYNLSGQCGLILKSKNHAEVNNDMTLSFLSEIAVSQAGANIVAPSSMMDGQVYSIRKALDRQGFQRTKVMSYSAKHFSSLYSPFRSAAFSAKIHDYNVIDKAAYQIAYTNKREILREIETDVLEGADIIMIKPAIAYLDLVIMIKERFEVPTAVQSVSGEYAMIKAAAKYRWIDEDEWKINSIVSMKRAGADIIISYFSMDIAKCLEQMSFM